MKAGDQNKYFDLAHIYFEAVRKFGWCAFNWGAERTVADLVLIFSRPSEKTA